LFNMLLDELPETVTIDGREYPVNWQYQCIIEVDNALHDPDIDENNRRLAALSLFYDCDIPDNILGALEQMYGFLVADKPMNRAQKSAAERYKNAPAVLSFDHDDEYIFAAFMQMYGINLNRMKGIHWYEFRAMLNALDDCPFTRIRNYRGTDLSKIKDAKERSRMAEIKALYELPVSQAEQDAMDEIEQALLNGGDLSRFFGD
jgi:Bacteriophage Gp15 protein.